MSEYTLSIFDKLENLPYVVRVTSESQDLSEIIVSAYQELLHNDPPLTKEYVEANEELFADYVIISIFVNAGENLVPDLEDENDNIGDEG
jgi:hypothetical protein